MGQHRNQLNQVKRELMRSSTSPNFLPFVFAFTIPPCSLPSPPVCLASLHEMLFVFSLHLFLSNLQHFVWLAPSDVSLNSVLPLKVNSCAWAVRHTSVWMRPSPGSGGDPMKLPGVSSCHVAFPACPTPDPFPEGGNHEITPYKQCGGMQCLQHHGCWNENVFPVSGAPPSPAPDWPGSDQWPRVNSLDSHA